MSSILLFIVFFLGPSIENTDSQFCWAVNLSASLKHTMAIMARSFNCSIHQANRLYIYYRCPNFMVVRRRKSPSNPIRQIHTLTHTTLLLSHFRIQRKTEPRDQTLLICSNLNAGLLANMDIFCTYVFARK